MVDAARGKRKVESRAARNIRWIESFCRVPEGRLVGQPVKLRPWQKAIIVGIYDQPLTRRTRRAIISFGRKNGKTALAACLLLLHLCGPEARLNSQLYSAAQSRDQAAILFGLAAKMVRMNEVLADAVTVRDSGKQLYCAELGTLYRALSADASTAYGLSPVFIVHDELGQVRGPKSELYEALETATAAQENPLSIVISTQAPTDADLLSVLIDDAKTEADPRTRLFLYTADESVETFTEAAIRAANPAFGDFQVAAEVLAMAEDARRQPSRQPEFENLVLNRRVEMFAPFVSRPVWQANTGDGPAAFDGLPVYGGLDLSETTDLTALVLIAPLDGIWHVRPTFWLPADGLEAKAKKDRVPYDTWLRQGYLTAAPGKTVDYSYVAEHLRNVCNDLDVRKIAFDRWNFRHLRPWLLKCGFSESEIEERFAEFGQGFASMSPALRTLESLLLNERLTHGRHPVLEMCAANAKVQPDPAGNRKLTKSKSRGRIDGMVALAMAVSTAETEFGEAEPSVYETRGFVEL